jgi:nucleoside-diphosphate-sugar epimerase
VKVLVTGAAGFLGSRLCEALLEQGHRVHGLDVLDGQEPPALHEARLEGARQDRRFSFRQADVTDGPLLLGEVRAFQPDAVLHLASRRDLTWAEDNPGACHRLHLDGALGVLHACRACNVPQALLGSSAHACGASRAFPWRESDPADRPLSHLGAAHRALELAASVHALRSPVSVTVFRSFSLYGPRQAPRNLLPALAAAAERGEPLPVHGDGTAGRDMLYVDDAVDGLMGLMARPAPWRLVNLASGETTTLGQVAEQVAFRMNARLKLRQLPPRPGELPNAWADIGLLQALLGFQPRVSLEDGLRRTIEWFRARPEAFRL